MKSGIQHRPEFRKSKKQMVHENNLIFHDPIQGDCELTNPRKM